MTISGRSGSGKSTLLHILGISDTYTSGKMIIDGENHNKKKEKDIARLRNEKIGFVLQDFALIDKPEMILADEPTGALDSENALEVVALLEKINSAGTTVVIVTHDETIAKRGKIQIVVKDGVVTIN